LERRFFEESFPIKNISIESVKEKRNRHSHISTLHLWWARRPLTASRATIFASLIDFKENEDIEKVHSLINKISKWENSLNIDVIAEAKKKISASNNKKTLRLLDPFSGGGSIPLEAIRLGCETYAMDYNPVATLILKCTFQYPLEFNNFSQKENELVREKNNVLLSELEKWGDWVETETKKEIGKFYPKEKDGSTLLGWTWARTVNCQNPQCGVEIPLLRQYWLAKSNSKKISLFPIISQDKIDFKIIGTDREPFPEKFDPSKGTIAKATVTCPICKSTIDPKMLKDLFRKNQSNQRMIAVISKANKEQGKRYRIADENDFKIFSESKKYLDSIFEPLSKKFGMSPFPDESLPPIGTLGFRVQLYNMKTWGDLFNERQKLSLIIFADKIRDAYKKMVKEGMDKRLSEAVTSYLALGFDRLVGFGSVQCTLNTTGGRGVAHTFGRNALPIVWDYMESNHFNDIAAGWNTAQDKNLKWIKHVLKIEPVKSQVKNASAMSLEYSDNFFDAVITDPPYYDNVPYSYLSDFFYVWLKRILSEIHPDLFSTPLTPKTNEIIAETNKENDGKTIKKTKKMFEEMLSKAFLEINRVLKEDGIFVIVYAHKSTEGWETLINSLLNSGLVVTGAWPINTEMGARLRAQESAALASSIYIVGRKWKKEEIGFYKEVKKELNEYLDKKIEQLWSEGISGADFFISAIASAIEVFGKYEKVVDDNDNTISTLKLLDDIRKIVTDYAINKVIKGEFSEEISQMTRFYILWRWSYGETKIPFDDAKKMAQSVGIDLEHEWNKGFIVKEKEFIRVLGPDERTEKGLLDSHDLIDILHKTLLIWKKEKKDDVDKFLEENGYKNSEVFKRVAQAISESLPLESIEKKWLDGFLTSFKLEDSQNESQSKLF
jgi:putative DNA methylase